MEMLLYLYAESPVHAGAADSLGVLDLPVQREASTGYPVIWGQSLKGALRRAAEEHPLWEDTPWVRAVFGSPVHTGEEAAAQDERRTTPGSLRVGDAQLVAMPVPTLKRTFAWVTSEIALGRLARKYHALGAPPDAVAALPATGRPGYGLSSSSEWTSSRGEVLGPCVVRFYTETDGRLAGWARRIAHDAIGAGEVFAPFAGKLHTDLLLVDSEIMPVLLRECTEQTVRVQLDKNKTVANGPFQSEYLPTETILAASLSLREPRQGGDGDTPEALRLLLNEALLQVGGDETLGKGLVWTRLVERVSPLADPAQAERPNASVGQPS